MWGWWAHPRLRGEHFLRRHRRCVCLGSSPLTRGALQQAMQWLRDRGLIPAYAGSTSSLVGQTGAATAHPRLRGEHVGRSLGMVARMGSSPLTRGARTPVPVCTWSGRLIPAYAGSTRKKESNARKHSAHPRLRGEHPDRASARFFSAWLIPAYAGSTRASLPGLRATRAHPRLRGEHSPIVSSARRAWGSSPLTRGARHKVGHRLRGQGLIPAYAGSTAESHVGPHPVEAHPRLRGEHGKKSHLSVR